jgi:threonine aldolase
MAPRAAVTKAVGVPAGPHAIVTVVMPQPPDQSFASDNAAGAHPQVIEALREANIGAALPYGQDPWTTRSVERFRALFGADVEVFFTYGGTGANVVSLQCLLAPHEAVICPTSAHMNVDECGAPERFTGAKLIDVPSSDGKLSPGTVRALLQPAHDEHNVTPRVLAISQPTELGTVYSVDEIGELAQLAHEYGLFLYVDGARIANAVAALGCSVRDLTYRTGVDVLTFGGTKNGLLYGEALVFLRPELAGRARFARKQAGQLASKMRFIAAQFDVLLQDDLWLAGAANANDMAARLASRVAGVPQVEIVRPVEVNSVFARLPAPLLTQLQNWSFFWDWDLNDGLVRWMTSFATSDEDVMRFAEGARSFADQYSPDRSRP